MLERVVLSGPLGSKSSFRLLVEGEWSLEQCQRVVDFLVMMRAHYRVDEAAEPERFMIVMDGLGRYVLSDARSDEPAPVYATADEAEAALAERLKE